jgi:ubiquinone/menaquinone biosynthesis C-methylase UbiE
MEQSTLAAQQFGAVASAYLTSAVHAQGADLSRLTELARSAPRLTALDLGCGAGHASYALAEGGAEATAYDLAPEMLAIVEAEARRRGLVNLQTTHGPAERLPFQDATFDLVVTRLSAHHWSDVPAALVEAGRVLKPGGSLIVIDVVAPESPLLDTILQTVEILRDASHVRDYRVSEWSAMFQAAGFQAPASDAWTLPTEFKSWTERMRTPELRVRAIRDVFERAPSEARAHFQLHDDGSFVIGGAWMQATVMTGVAV